MTRPVFSIIVVSYNTCEMTCECIRSIYRETQSISFEVIVIDNASSDNSVEELKKEFNDRIKLIALPENIGFAAGNNHASKLCSGEYLLLLNPDTVILGRAIEKLFDFMQKKPDAGIWGGRTQFSDGSLNRSSCWSRQTLWSLVCQALGLTSIFRNSTLFNPEGIGGWDRKGVRYVDIVSGCFLLISRTLWDQLGGFREIFFMYGEEADLCLRAKHYGTTPIVSSGATIIHHGGASETVRVDKLVRLMKAKMLLIRSHFPEYQKKIGYFLLASWPWSRALALRLLMVIKPSLSVKQKVWQEVFNRRGEWYVE